MQHCSWPVGLPSVDDFTVNYAMVKRLVVKEVKHVLHRWRQNVASSRYTKQCLEKVIDIHLQCTLLTTHHHSLYSWQHSYYTVIRIATWLNGDWEQCFYQACKICFWLRVILTVVVLAVIIITSDKGGSTCFCTSVCLSVSKITQKRMHGFGWNVARRQMSGHGRTY